jgi:hypothetical protein
MCVKSNKSSPQKNTKRTQKTQIIPLVFFVSSFVFFVVNRSTAIQIIS